ncbi:MAG: hypothetical protein H9535_05485 [Ignavibacteria bacterium]|nr:hypothetical protein [Ignavibacteria bacterium]
METFEFNNLLERLKPYCTSKRRYEEPTSNGLTVIFDSKEALNIFRTLIPEHGHAAFNDVLFAILQLPPSDIENTVVATCASYLNHFCEGVPAMSLN